MNRNDDHFNNNGRRSGRNNKSDSPSFFSKMIKDFKIGIKTIKDNILSYFKRQNTADNESQIAKNEYHENQPQSVQNVSIFKKRTKEHSFLVSTLLTSVFIFVLVLAFLGVAGIGAVVGVANAYVDTTPVLDIEKIENLSESSFIYDSNGEYITTFSGLENRIYVPIDEIPTTLQEAFVAVEDSRFYTHNGIDPKRIVGAFFNNLRTDTTQGGSTITQQLIKLRLLSNEQTYKRKLQEAYLAIQLEQTYTKDQILESYLNTIDLGSGNYGIKAAAIDYFGKELDELTLRECALLAGVARSSYLYNPRSNYYVWETPKRLVDRTNTVLYRMYQSGYITKEEYDEALKEPDHIVEESQRQKMYDMPYFLEYSISDVVTKIIEARGMTVSKTNRSLVENELRTKGYHIYTTVDRDIQLTVESSLYTWDDYPNTMYKSSSTMIVPNGDGTTQEIVQPQAAAAVYDYTTGELKAIVGGRQEPTVMKAFNRAYQSHMPVGSSIKPLAVYGPALNNGISPASVVLDLPLPVQGWLSERGYPSNYSGKFTGPITVRTALMRSVNMAAVRILVDEVGIEQSYNTLVDLGINPDYINKDGAGLGLGTSGITVIDMSVAFGAIGNNGVYIEPISFTKVVDNNGNIIIDATQLQIQKPVFTPAADWLLVDLLKDAVKSGTGTHANISGMTVAGKTGTNSDYRGVFFAGLTPYYSAAVWVGHDGYEQLERTAQGGRDAAPLWQDFMSKIHQDKALPNKDILQTTPSELGLTKVKVCSVSGLRATDACSLDASGRTPVTDYFQSGTAPTEFCDQHYLVNICTETNLLATPYCPNVTAQALLVIPTDSPINQLDDQQFIKYFPYAVRGIEDINSLLLEGSHEDPLYADHYCSIHTLEWYENDNKMKDAVSSAEALLSEVSSLLTQYGDNLDENHMNQINEAINNLNLLKTAQDDYAALVNATQSLRTLKEAYLDIYIVPENP
ncbi:MAG: PBP1A family penicillin-binding protein [Eubacteriales bacterium]